MKIIIAGSRGLSPRMDQIHSELFQAGWCADEIVSGGARGVDKAGERFADTELVPVRRFPANWTKYGKKAGPLRNAKMAKYADALMAFWDGESPGTRNMISLMEELGKPCHVVKCHVIRRKH